MDNGGYIWVYNGSRYIISKEDKYYAVHDKQNSHKHVASFKEQDEAIAYALWRQSK